MDWLVRMTRAMDYLEENLDGELDYGKAAQAALTSSFHFQRMFAFITGVTLAEYVRRRRLTLAAFELQNSSVGIVDLAVKYGYDSRESFSRAFQKLHGVSPRRGEKEGRKAVRLSPNHLSHHFERRVANELQN